MLRMFPKSLINEVSPDSELLRKTAKLPMFFILVCDGLIGGIATTFFKMCGELAIEKDLESDGWFILLLLACAIPGNLLQLYFVNIGMKYYDQIEVIPVFMAAQLSFVLISGLIILNEQSQYTFS